MSTTQLKSRLRGYINQGDSRLLRLLYAVASEYAAENVITPGKPMEAQVLKDRVKQARARVRKGRFATQEEVERQSALW